MVQPTSTEAGQHGPGVGDHLITLPELLRCLPVDAVRSNLWQRLSRSDKGSVRLACRGLHHLAATAGWSDVLLVGADQLAAAPASYRLHPRLLPRRVILRVASSAVSARPLVSEHTAASGAGWAGSAGACFPDIDQLCSSFSFANSSVSSRSEPARGSAGRPPPRGLPPQPPPTAAGEVLAGALVRLGTCTAVEGVRIVGAACADLDERHLALLAQAYPSLEVVSLCLRPPAQPLPLPRGRGGEGARTLPGGAGVPLGPLQACSKVRRLHLAMLLPDSASDSWQPGPQVAAPCLAQLRGLRSVSLSGARLSAELCAALASLGGQLTELRVVGAVLDAQHRPGGGNPEAQQQQQQRQEEEEEEARGGKQPLLPAMQALKALTGLQRLEFGGRPTLQRDEEGQGQQGRSSWPGDMGDTQRLAACAASLQHLVSAWAPRLTALEVCPRLAAGVVVGTSVRARRKGEGGGCCSDLHHAGGIGRHGAEAPVIHQRPAAHTGTGGVGGGVGADWPMRVGGGAER